jgi:DNA-directed RNA polymerase subunit RPC12/RpoP
MVSSPSLAEALPLSIDVKCPACGFRVNTRQSGNTTRCATASGGCGTAFYVPSGLTRPLVGVTCRKCRSAWSTRAAGGSTIRCPRCSHPRRVPVNIRAARPARPQRSGSTGTGSTSSSSRSTSSRSTSSRSTGTGSTGTGSRSTSSRSTGTGSTGTGSTSSSSRSMGSLRRPQAQAPKVTFEGLLAQMLSARQSLKTAPAAASVTPAPEWVAAPSISRRATAGLGAPRRAMEPLPSTQAADNIPTVEAGPRLGTRGPRRAR